MSAVSEDFRDWMRRKTEARALRSFNKKMHQTILKGPSPTSLTSSPTSSSSLRSVQFGSLGSEGDELTAKESQIDSSPESAERAILPDPTPESTPARPRQVIPIPVSTPATPPQQPSGPTLGPSGSLSLTEQLRTLVIQFSLARLSPATVRTALDEAVQLLTPGSSELLVLNEMIAEQRQQLGYPSVETDRKGTVYYIDAEVVTKAEFDASWRGRGVVPVARPDPFDEIMDEMYPEDIDLVLPSNPFGCATTCGCKESEEE